MHLLCRIQDYRHFLAMGQISVALGIILTNADRLGFTFLSNLGEGFCHGMGGMFIGLSLVFHVMTMIKYRQYRRQIEN